MPLEVKEKIVAVALDRIHALGYTAAGMQEISDLAGIHKGSLYYYFKSKELLALDVVELYVQKGRFELLEDGVVPPKMRLLEHFEAMASIYADLGYEKGCLLTKLAAEITPASAPALYESICATFDIWSAKIAAVIEEGRGKGDFNSTHDTDRVARWLLDGWQGATVRMKFTADRSPLDEFLSIALPSLTDLDTQRIIAGPNDRADSGAHRLFAAVRSLSLTRGRDRT